MIRTLIAAFTVFIALCASAPAQVTATTGEERPRLKAEAVVNSELVRVGDLVEHAGIIADVPIFRSPDLGATGTVSATAVAEAVRAHALVGLDTAGLQEVEVTRASRAIAPKEIEDTVARALAVKFRLGKPADLTLEFDNGLRALQVDPSAEGSPRVASVTYDTYNGRFRAILEIPTGPTSRAPLRVSGHATVTQEVAVVARTVERGATLKDADVVIERRPRAQVGHGTFTDRAQAIGLAARNTLQPGRPLQSSQLMKPQMIKRNEQVTLVYEVPGIMLTVRGKAMEGGSEGDTISVLNEQSKRTLQGIIVGPGRVVIGPRMPQLAANAAPPQTGTTGGAH